MDNGEHKTSQAQLKASANYQRKQTQIVVRFPREYRQLVDDRAKELGLSVNAYMITLIEKDLHTKIDR